MFFSERLRIFFAWIASFGVMSIVFLQFNDRNGPALDSGVPASEVQSDGTAMAGIFQLPINPNVGFTGMDLKDAQHVFASYCNNPTITCPNITRFGNEGDGGYEVCTAPAFLKPDNCIVYSFGISNNWSFDDDARSHGCEVHSFDPSINTEDHERAPGHYFHNLGLWHEDMTNTDGWKLATLATIIKQLGHSEKLIDILKIDTEGAEWPFLRQFIHTEWPQQIRQLVLEIHTPVYAGTKMTVDSYQAIYNDLTTLRDKHHYKLYQSLHINDCCKRFAGLIPHGLVTPRELCCLELYYINMTPQAP